MKIINLTAVIAAILFSSNIYATPVNINTATADVIANSLTGIGMNKAQAIVNYRKENGNFAKASDIVQVKGIGHSIFIKNKTDILIK